MGTDLPQECLETRGGWKVVLGPLGERLFAELLALNYEESLRTIFRSEFLKFNSRSKIEPVRLQGQ